MRIDLTRPSPTITKAIECSHGKDAISYFCRGVALGIKGKYEDAVRDYTAALRINPRDADVLFDRAVALSHVPKLDLAIKDVAKVIDLNARMFDAYLVRAGCWLDKCEAAKAADDCEKGCMLRPATPYGYLTCGFARQRIGQLNAAIDEYGKAIDIDPTFVSAYRFRADALFKMGRIQNAASDLKHFCYLAQDGEDKRWACAMVRRFGTIPE